MIYFSTWLPRSDAWVREDYLSARVWSELNLCPLCQWGVYCCVGGSVCDLGNTFRSAHVLILSLLGKSSLVHVSRRPSWLQLWLWVREHSSSTSLFLILSLKVLSTLLLCLMLCIMELLSSLHYTLLRCPSFSIILLGMEFSTLCNNNNNNNTHSDRAAELHGSELGQEEGRRWSLCAWLYQSAVEFSSCWAGWGEKGTGSWFKY